MYQGNTKKRQKTKVTRNKHCQFESCSIESTFSPFYSWKSSQNIENEKQLCKCLIDCKQDTWEIPDLQNNGMVPKSVIEQKVPGKKPREGTLKKGPRSCTFHKELTNIPSSQARNRAFLQCRCNATVSGRSIWGSSWSQNAQNMRLNEELYRRDIFVESNR